VKTGTGRVPTHSVSKAFSGQWRISAMTDDLCEGRAMGVAYYAARQIVQNTNMIFGAF
jgi:hypothetical protein